MNATSTASTDASNAPERPGKIIAVHLSYASRAAQRGRVPAAPSYFFKPGSSVAGNGETVQRPAGTELLAFEGEIALRIGKAARWVTADDAWSHVDGVSASNDLGVYDLRAVDKGSNVRSKGREGYTPLGPTWLDAAALDPAALRVRTWVNGELRQEGSTDDLLFPLAQIVADLSQHLTLEPGDVILTGTPAGSSVLQPGDVVEVEVDAPAASDAPSTGRLRTTVSQDEHPFDESLGSLPQVDDTQRLEAWGSAQEAGLADAADSADAQQRSVAESLRSRLAELPTASLSSALRAAGVTNHTIVGVAPLVAGQTLVGQARTLRFVPNREDLQKAHGGGYNAQKRIFDTVGAGEVIVVEARGELGSGTVGDVLALRAQFRDGAGVVTDGGVRDHDAVAATGLPVFAATSHPSVLGLKHIPWDIDATISCGGTVVQPGDWLVGDADGVVVVPQALAEQVADAAREIEDRDAFVADRVREGNGIDGLFPMNKEWLQRYHDSRPQQPGQDEA